MDEVTQHNSALVEENAAASQALHVQAAMLDRMVARFELPPGSLERAPRILLS